MAGYCNERSVHGMVNVRNRHCSYESCTRAPTPNFAGEKKAAYSKRHAVDSMVNVVSRRCSYDRCPKIPTFNIEGRNCPAYSKQHAEDSMIDVRCRSCFHIACTRRARWGLLADGAATACAHHKSDTVGLPVIHLTTICNVTGCGKRAKRGLSGKQPSHSRQHDPLEDGPVCTVTAGMARPKRAPPSPPYRVIVQPGSSQPSSVGYLSSVRADSCFTKA